MQPKTLIRAMSDSVSGLPRAFWWLWISTLINRLGQFVATFLALYLTAERGQSASYAGLVVALYGLGGVVSSVVAGVLTDRLGRRPTLMFSQLSSAASVALLAFMTHPVAIAVVALLVGMASNASRPAVQAMMADIVRPEDRMRAFSLNYWAINLGFAVSAAAAGFIAEISYVVGFLAEAGLTLACAVVVFAKLPESRPEREPVPVPAGAGTSGAVAGQGAKDAPEPGLGTVLRDGRFMGVVCLSFVIALIFQQAYVGLPVALAQAGFSPADFGLAISVNGLLIVAVQLPATKVIEHRDPRRLMIVSSLLAGYGFGLTAFAGSVGFFVLTVCVWTLAEIINAPTQTGLVVRLSPTHARGRYQGIYTLSWSGATLVAPLVAGVTVDRLGPAWLWAGCAVVGTAAALGYGVLMRDLPTETAETAETGGTGETGGTAAGTGGAVAEGTGGAGDMGGAGGASGASGLGGSGGDAVVADVPAAAVAEAAGAGVTAPGRPPRTCR